MSSISPERIETQIFFALGLEHLHQVSNVFIRSKIEGMESFDCKKHYSKLGFKIAKITYDRVLGLFIQVEENTIPENKPGILIMPERYIVCVGVDEM